MLVIMDGQVEVKLAAVVKQWESASLSVLPAISAANHGRRLLCIHQLSASELLATLEESQVSLQDEFP